MNGNGCVLATAGSGKSFAVKQQIEQIMLRYPEDDVVIIDGVGVPLNKTTKDYIILEEK